MLCSNGEQFMNTLNSGINSDVVPNDTEVNNHNVGNNIKKEKSPNSMVSRIPLTRLSKEHKAKRCRFFRNGDQWFPGTVIAIGNDKYRTWEALLEDLTRILDHPQHLANGVRYIFAFNGKKISSLNCLEEGSEYVASSYDVFKNIDYQKAKLPQWRITVKRKEALHVHPNKYNNIINTPITSSYTGSINSPSLNSTTRINKEFIKPKFITIFRNGVRPRKSVRILLNHKTARSFEQVLDDITSSINLNSGAVRKVFSTSGKQIKTLEDFFADSDTFIAYGTEKHCLDDLEFDSDELKNVHQYNGAILATRNHQRMPSPHHKASSPSANTLPRKKGALPRALQTDAFNSEDEEMNGVCEALPLGLLSRYTIGHTLGDGNFAIVKYCSSIASQEEFALKIIDKGKCKGKEQMIESEVTILRKIKHPNIVSLIEEFETKNHLYLVLELVKGGDLFDAIANATKYSEEEARCMLNDVTSALFYLHQRNIVHRDIKPENLLVELDSTGETRLKLADFGLAVRYTQPLFTVCGTPTYVAPEILAETGYGLEVDIWATGVIAYILLCGFPPFVSPTNDQEELFDQILRGHYEFHSPYWDPISVSAKQLISSMLQVDSERRFTASQVLDHLSGCVNGV